MPVRTVFVLIRPAQPRHGPATRQLRDPLSTLHASTGRRLPLVFALDVGGGPASDLAPNAVAPSSLFYTPANDTTPA
nr:predicted protein [Mycena chlorophos]